MLATLALYAAALVAAASATGTEYDPMFELDAYPDMRLLRHRHHARGAHHYRRHHGGLHHLRGHPHHKMALTHHSATPTYTNWNPEGDEDSAPVLLKGTVPQMLPGRHPSVEKALDGMSGDLQELKEKQLAAKQTRGELEGKVNEVVHHMNDAMSIKHAIAHKEAEMRIEGNKLKNLEREADHMDETHTSLVASLHRVLEPKVQIAQQRLEKKEMVLAKEEKVAKGWHDKKDELHEHAIKLLGEKKEAKRGLLQAEREVAEAQKKEEWARGKYESERRKVAEEVTSFRYADTRFKAEVTHEESAKQSALAAQESVKKLNKVFEIESVKVEESVQVSKNRINHRMGQIQAKREKTEHELGELKNRYREWQESERQRAAVVVRTGQDTAVAAEAYENKQKNVLESAQKKVVDAAEAKGDWAWEGGFSNEAGFQDSNPSLSD